MSYDDKCHELAEHFLPDECETKQSRCGTSDSGRNEDWLEAQRGSHELRPSRPKPADLSKKVGRQPMPWPNLFLLDSSKYLAIARSEDKEEIQKDG